MPGWDWWRTYPWSPYNYGRNPYNPAYVAYPVYAYPPYLPEGEMAAGTPTGSPYGTGTSSTVDEFLPDPTGPMTTAPATAGVIRLRVPDEFAQVWFDGESTESIGRIRYYVTPDLPSAQFYSYALKVQWNNGGTPMTENRAIEVRSGQITNVDIGARQAR
jgi:uncharacterized protein (TIGR03000 family)